MTIDRFERGADGVWLNVHDEELERRHNHILAKLDALNARLDMLTAAILSSIPVEEPEP